MKKRIKIKAVLFVCAAAGIIAGGCFFYFKPGHRIYTAEELARKYQVYGGDFVYEITKDDKGEDMAVIHKYTGTAAQVYIPEEIAGVPVRKLQGQKDLEKGGIIGFVDCVDIPDSVKEIGDYAFAGSSVRKIGILKPVDIGKYAFANCRNLETNYGPERDKYYYGELLPQGVSRMGEGAFLNCVNIDRLELSQNLEKLPDRCFEGCKNMRSISFGTCYTSIGERAFLGCSSLECIDFGPESNLTQIGKRAFEGTAVAEVVLPGKLELLGSNAFKDCIALRKVSLPLGAQAAQDAFEGCVALREVNILDYEVNTPNFESYYSYG